MDFQLWLAEFDRLSEAAGVLHEDRDLSELALLRKQFDGGLTPDQAFAGSLPLNPGVRLTPTFEKVPSTQMLRSLRGLFRFVAVGLWGFSIYFGLLFSADGMYHWLLPVSVVTLIGFGCLFFALSELTPILAAIGEDPYLARRIRERLEPKRMPGYKYRALSNRAVEVWATLFQCLGFVFMLGSPVMMCIFGPLGLLVIMGAGGTFLFMEQLIPVINMLRVPRASKT